MASTIQLKTGTGSAVPSSLTQGEVAINVDNGLIYYGSGSVNSVKQLDAFTNITASVISASGHIFAERIAIGDGDSSFAGQLTVEEDIVANRNITGDNQTAILGIKQIISNDFISGSRLISHTHITASNNISASGEIIGNKIFGNLIGGKTDGSGIVLGSASDIHVTASGNISASLNSKIFASSASFGGASFLRAFNVKGAGLDGRLNLQGTAGTDNPGIEFTVNDNTSRALIRLDQVGTNGTALEFFTEPDGGDIANTLTIGHTGHITASGDIKIGGNLHLSASANGHITASGNISASGNLIGTQLDVNGFAGAVKVTGGDTGNLFAISSINTLNLGKLAHLTTTNLVGSLHMSQPDAGHITASGNISASGTIFSETEEILLFSSFKAVTMTSDPHRFIPSQNGMNYYLMLDTNVTDISGSFVSSTTQANQHNGFMVPYKFLVTGIECQGRSSAGSNTNPVVFELQLHTGTPPNGTNTNTSYANVASLSASSGNVGQGGSGTKHRNSFTYTQGGEPFIVSQSQMLTPSLRRIDGDAGISSTNGWISFTIKGHKIK